MKSSPIIFVTGATGFLGGHFLREVERRGWRLRCLARDRAMSRRPNVEWVHGDLLKPSRWKARLRGCDAVVHLAVAQLGECEEHPMRSCRVIVQGTGGLVRLSLEAGVRRFLMASTAEVYGTPSRLPASENTPLRPQSLYGYFKACADLHALALAGDGDLSLCILRFFNLYGNHANGMAPRTVLRLFAERIVAAEPIVLHASLRNSRDFLHVKDAARALALAVCNEKARGVIPVGSGRETTLHQAARMLARLAGRPLKVDFRPKEGRMRRIVADTRLARQRLEFVPKVSLEQGLREVLQGVIA